MKNHAVTGIVVVLISILSNRTSSNLHKIQNDWLRKLRQFFLPDAIKTYPQSFIQHASVATLNIWQCILYFIPMAIVYFLLLYFWNKSNNILLSQSSGEYTTAWSSVHVWSLFKNMCNNSWSWENWIWWCPNFTLVYLLYQWDSDWGEDPQGAPQGAPKMDFFQRQFTVILSNRIMLQKIQEVHPSTHKSTQAV